MKQRLSDAGLQIGDLTVMHRLDMKDMLLIFVGTETMTTYLQLYKFMEPGGRLHAFVGSNSCEVLSRIADALG